VAYLVGLSIVLGLGRLLIMTAAQPVVALVQNLPAYAQWVQRPEPQLLQALRPLGITGSNLQAFNQQALTAAQTIGGALAAGFR
jgi:predicted PurR-regulated permease PerM